MEKKIKILHLEDSVKDSELIRSLIESGGLVHEYFLADNETDYVNILMTEKINIILSDYNLPDYNGNEALKYARENYPHLPFIFVSGTIGEDAAIDTMLNGATDYVLKHKLERLIPAIIRAQHEQMMVIKRAQAEEALRESEKKYKSLINELNDGYFIANLHGVFTFANYSMAKILGFTSPEELKVQFNKTISIQKLGHIFNNIIENKEKVDGLEMEIISKDGRTIYIEISAIPVKVEGKYDGMQGIIQDITDRKLGELNLKEKNELIEAQNIEYIQINKELAYQNKKKEKREAELMIANEELAFQSEEREKRAAELIIANIEKAAEQKYKQLIEDKNTVITDSINYAQRIQQAKLPRKEEIYATLSNSFVLFKPKAIVSGDFYFFHKNSQTVFIVAADCTGHGVPGALMSMIGSEKLHEATLQSSNTSDILKFLNNGIKKSLHQTDKYESTKDGMDIAICAIELNTKIVHYAGANIPLLIVRKGNMEVEEIKGTKEAIGGFTKDSQYFKSHTFELHSGDTIYMSTDGYADQFGGPSGKKLMKKKFKEILIEIQNKSMSEQEKYLSRFIESWRNNTEQIDDILVIGIRM